MSFKFGLLVTAFLQFGSISTSFAKDILIVGDSLTCGPFGEALVKNISKDPRNKVVVYCTVSSSPKHWVTGTNPGAAYPCHSCSGTECSDWIAKKSDEDGMPKCKEAGDGITPKFSDILKNKKYDKVIVALGTNRKETGEAVDSNYAEMVNLIESSPIASCDWIGPPYRDQTKPIFDEQKQYDDEASRLKARQAVDERRRNNLKYNHTLDPFYLSLKSTVVKSKKCALIDSRDYTANPATGDTIKDGVHRTSVSGGAWADGITPLLISAKTPASIAPAVR